MSKFKIGDRVVDHTIKLDESRATVVEVREDRIRVRWDIDQADGTVFWLAEKFDLIENGENQMTKYSSILEPGEPVRYRVKPGQHVLSNGSVLEIEEAYADLVCMKFRFGRARSWNMTKEAVAELIEVLNAIHDAMDD